MSEINVTPLVDVMLVLLIIFMVTAPLLKAAVPIELPESRAMALAEERRQIDIAVARAGRIYVENDPVAPGELPDRLAAITPGADGRPPLVTLRADKAVDWGRAMAVMGELNRAGFNSISLVTAATGAEPAVIGGSGGGQ
ncbi:MAG: biopolymer transporter ExbD [Novosphingobium sp.]|nr:biopolymer transporter ExbD [Novosphingobium sp.]